MDNFQNSHFLFRRCFGHQYYVCSSYYTPLMAYGIHCMRPEGKCSKYAVHHRRRVVSDLPKISTRNLNFSASCRGAALDGTGGNLAVGQG